MENKLQEFIKKANNEKILQDSIDLKECENIPSYIEKLLNNLEVIQTGLDTDTHRWYETSITVFKWNNENYYLGIRHITNIYSENMMVEDVYHHLEFMEMEKIETITFKLKNR